jgi:thiamine-monophosphate kinase
VLQPGAGVRLRREAIPLSRSLRALARKRDVSPLEWALGGGEDFELVLTVPKKHWAALEQVGSDHKVLITAVGEVTEAPDILLDDDDVSSRFKGFEHFRR